MRPGVWVKAFGGLLVCVSLAYIGFQVWSFRGQLADWQPDLLSLASVVASALLYAFACWPLSAAWRHLLISLEPGKPHSHRLIHVYAKSQLGKYLPGNVAHLAGRHVIARARGYSHRSLLLSTVYEFCGLLSAAGTAASMAIFIPGEIFSSLHPGMRAVVLLCPILPMFYLAHRTLPSLFERLKLGRFPESSGALQTLAIPCLYYFTFFIFAGFSLVLLVLPIADALSPSECLLLCFAFSVSWIFGYLTPGAPSGIGVREAVLVYILTPAVGVPEALLIAVLFRVATICGDIVFWLWTAYRSQRTGNDTLTAQ